MKKVRFTRTATTVSELEIDETKKGGVFYGYDSLDELIENEKGLADGDFFEAFAVSVELNGLVAQKCEVEIVDG